MSSRSNSIELVIKVLDEASKGIRDIAEQMGVAEKAADSFKEVFAGLAVGFTLDKLVESITEAQTATNDLNRQFASFGATVGVTKENMVEFAESTSKATTLTSESLKEAQANLLNYTRVTGKSFTDARSLVVDLAAKMGGDAATAAELLGRALQNPVSGIRLLAQVGVTLTNGQRATIESLTQTGDSAQAVNFILATLRQRVEGAAAALTNTLGGSLTQIKNSFRDAFTGQGADVEGLVDQLHNFNDAVNSKDAQQGIQTIVSGLVTLAEAAVKATTAIATFIKEAGEEVAHITNGADSPMGVLLDKKSELETVISAGGENGSDVTKYIEQLKAVEDQITALGKAAEEAKPAVQDFNDFGTQGKGWDKPPPVKPPPLFDPLELPIGTGRAGATTGLGISPMNAVEKVIDQQRQSVDAAYKSYSDYLAADTKLEELIRESTSTGDNDTVTRLQKVQQQLFDDQFKPIQVTATKMQIPLNEIEKEGIQVAGTLSDAFANIFESGDFSARNFLKTMLSAFDQIFAKAASQDIIELLGIKSLFSGVNSSTQSGGLLGAFFNIFGSTTSGYTGPATTPGFSAGGGDMFGAKIVGENGPELFMPGQSGKVMNRNQLNFAGGGGGFSYAPVNNITVVSDNSGKTTGDLARFLTAQQTKQQQEFERKMARNGIKLR